MSNVVSVQFTRFQDLDDHGNPDGEPTYGYRIFDDYACKSGYCVSNRSGTNSKVYGVLGGERNADRTV